MIKLYHGSNVSIDKIDLSLSRKDKDFGCGFYLNANRQQAIDMAVRTTERTNIGEPTVSTFIFDDTRLRRKCEQVEKLIWKRKHLLDKMFVATPEEVERMEQVNNRLLDLTQKMYARTEALYRKVITATYAPEYDDDVEVKGMLKFSANGHCSILPMANDDYYGSNFYEMFCVINWLYTCNVLNLEEIEQCRCYLYSSDYRPDMSSKELPQALLHTRHSAYERLLRGGKEIYNRTRLYFHDYLEDLFADMSGVEQWKEPLSDEIHYRWRPQKDCYYIDENVDDYLHELY